jgi:hypothetical protein
VRRLLHAAYENDGDIGMRDIPGADRKATTDLHAVMKDKVEGLL